MDYEIKTSIGKRPIPIEERIKGIAPLCDGLYPHEILALSVASYYTNKTDRFPVFWEWTYGINDLQDIFKSLINRGYIMTGNIEDCISFQKVPFIKEQLKKRKLKVSGRKADLIQRLIENVPEDDLSVDFNETPYLLTKKGEEVLKKYDWVPYIHKKFSGYIDMWNFSVLMSESPQTDYKDKIWEYLHRKSTDLYNDNRIGSYRNCVLTLSNFAYDNGELQKAFKLLCKVMAYDLIYPKSNFEPDMFSLCLSYDSFFDPKYKMIPRPFLRWLKAYMDAFGWNGDMLRRQIIDNISKVNLPIILFSPEECGDIVIAELEQDNSRIKEIYSKAKKRFKKVNRKIFREIEELESEDHDSELNKIIDNLINVTLKF